MDPAEQAAANNGAAAGADAAAAVIVPVVEAVRDDVRNNGEAIAGALEELRQLGEATLNAIARPVTPVINGVAEGVAIDIAAVAVQPAGDILVDDHS
jgi:hypothetical protein